MYNDICRIKCFEETCINTDISAVRGVQGGIGLKQ